MTAPVPQVRLLLGDVKAATLSAGSPIPTVRAPKP